MMDNGLTPVTAAKQVESLKETFTQLQTLFVIVSGFIVVIALIAAADGLLTDASEETATNIEGFLKNMRVPY